jgi:hypothetical protein
MLNFVENLLENERPSIRTNERSGMTKTEYDPDRSLVLIEDQFLF